MAGSVTAGKKAAQTNMRLHGRDFYRRIGRIGGQRGRTGGFHNNHELAVRAGRLGGLKSKRGKSKQ